VFNTYFAHVFICNTCTDAYDANCGLVVSKVMSIAQLKT